MGSARTGSNPVRSGVKLFVGFLELSSRLSIRSDLLVTREPLGYASSTLRWILELARGEFTLPIMLIFFVTRHFHNIIYTTTIAR